MVKKISIIALLFIIVGGIASAITFSAAKEKTAAVTTDISDFSFNAVQIDVTNTDVELMPTQEQAKIEVVGRSAQKRSNELSVDQQGDILSIHSEDKTKKWFSFGFDQSPKIIVYVPEKEYDSIQVKGKTADLYVEKIAAKNIDIATNAGDIVAENLTSDQLAVKATSGDVRLDQITGDTSAETKSGDIVLSNIDAANVQSLTRSGDTAFKNVSGEVQAKTRSGDFSLRNDQISSPITAETSNGDIFIQAQNYPENVQFDTATKHGDILIFDQKKQTINNQNQGTMIQLETKNGDIIVKKK
ncbi:hypothetical protein J14TS2_24590 [Bacillus sp. J14TS2]|uniref:DUF4097 family beta strand repeat-containing protein n=1 Tax=Bacillus sp. J14TS2 TaxID=2807188 RepID=UPI001B135CA2|nr:DUF4097 family beta strand repeat-containing protein [Bacillus sp. J14TS2]GIN71984.1 hypothetical protein J14TS2_24590 [Bacillus sp. J14TS2]